MQKPASIVPSRNVPFVGAVFRFLEGRDTVQAAAEILQQAERNHGLSFAPLMHAPTATEKDPDEDTFTTDALQPFLLETHFIVSGGDYQSCLRLYDAQGYERSYSWRHWGGEIADFANAYVPRTANTRAWDYIDFYSTEYTQHIVQNYRVWLDALMRVIDLKLNLYGVPLTTYSPRN